MTIAVGILCEDNSVVIAADSQETLHGYWKLGVVKPGAGVFGPRGDVKARFGMLTAGAGRSGYIDALDQRLHAAVGHSTLRVAVDKIGEELREFYRLHVSSYPDLPEIQMLIGLGQVGRKRGWLFSTDRGALVQSHSNAAVGIGAGHALALLGNYHSVKTCRQGVALGAYVVHHTKRHVADCGSYTSIACIENGRPKYVPYEATEAMDKIFDEYMDVEVPFMTMGLLGMVDVVGPGDLDHLAKMHARLRRLSGRRSAYKANPHFALPPDPPSKEEK